MSMQHFYYFALSLSFCHIKQPSYMHTCSGCNHWVSILCYDKRRLGFTFLSLTASHDRITKHNNDNFTSGILSPKKQTGKKSFLQSFPGSQTVKGIYAKQVGK